jgi:hypothetical protein
MRKRAMVVEEADLADAERAVVRHVERESKGTKGKTHPEITEGGTEVVPAVAMMVEVGVVMVAVPVSPVGRRAEVRGAETVRTPPPPFPKGVSEVAGIVSALPTGLHGVPVPAIKGLATAGAGLVTPPFSKGRAVVGDMSTVSMVTPLGIDVSTGPAIVNAVVA